MQLQRLVWVILSFEFFLSNIFPIIPRMNVEYLQKSLLQIIFCSTETHPVNSFFLLCLPFFIFLWWLAAVMALCSAVSHRPLFVVATYSNLMTWSTWMKVQVFVLVFWNFVVAYWRFFSALTVDWHHGSQNRALGVNHFYFENSHLWCEVAETLSSFVFPFASSLR